MHSAPGSWYAVSRLWAELRAVSLATQLVVVSVGASVTSSALVLPLCLQAVTQALQAGGGRGSVLPLAALTMAVLLVGYGFELAVNMIAADANRRICTRLAQQHIGGHVRSTLADFERFERGDYAGAMADVLELLQTQQLFMLQNGVSAIIVTALSIVILGSYNILLLALVLPAVLSTCLLPVALASLATPYIDREPQAFSALGQFLASVVAARQVLHFAPIDGLVDHARALTDNLHRVQTGKWWIWNLSFNLKLTQNLILYALILLAGGLLYFGGGLPLASVVATYVLVTMIAPKLDAIYKLYNFAQSTSAAYRALDRLLLPAEAVGAEAERSPAVAPIRSLSLRVPSFAYRPDAAPVLKDVAIDLRVGEHCLILGASGSGKSSLLDLLLGLRGAPGSSLLVNGVSIMATQRAEFWRQVAYVPNPDLIFNSLSADQNFALFGDGAAPDHARAAEALRYGTFSTSPGAALSGGERQRLAVLRALSRNRSIIILDEPTSALDDAMLHATFALIAAQRAKIVIVASHSRGIEGYFDRIFDVQQHMLHERR